jgi:hypothetical protein
MLHYIYQLKKYDGGFYNHITILMTHYLMSKEMGASFYIDDQNWIFANNTGWSDYFESRDLVFNHTKINSNDLYIYIKGNPEIPNYISNIKNLIIKDENYYHRFKILDYTNSFPLIYKLNFNIINNMNLLLKSINFNIGNFDAILIRRGNKMFHESKLFNAEEYVQPLIDRNTQNIYIETDDYNAYLDVSNIINTKYKDKNINIFTKCPTNKFGGAGYISDLQFRNFNECRNKEYCEFMVKNTQKSIQEYTTDEMKIHIEDMLIGNEICKLARFFVTDFQSNITRFICMTHKNKLNIINIENNFMPDFNSEYDLMGEVFLNRRYYD